MEEILASRLLPRWGAEANGPELFCFKADRWASSVEITGGWELDVDWARRPCSRLMLGFETVEGRDGDVDKTNTLRARGLVGVAPRVTMVDGIFTATETSVFTVTDEIERAVTVAVETI